ncbi:PREDICTED: uncharacterized protein LOC109157855 [Ipomoea nil]|uniref:uncharacterized protein LOC109157855 n=1 Tax=Ipomoea nil TaxID=35883 RepID=UPI000901C6CB|nr:PREDICTED: uncharacterized protein LOC109157855 [Ipomoea nil]
MQEIEMASAIRALIFFVLISQLLFSSSGTVAALITSPPSSLLADVFSELGFRELAAVTAAANISIAAAVTVFAPADSAFLTCPSCSLPLLLQEHSLPGLYSIHYLRTFAFGTKIETLAPDRCLTVTSSAAAAAAKKVFVNGAEVTKADLFNNGRVIIHGLQGFVSHLSHLSCQLDRQTTLVVSPEPSPAAAIFAAHRLLKQAMMQLRASGYSIVALAMRVKYPELSELTTMTVFALDDASIFASGEGHAYVADLGFHIVPNRLLTASELIALPPGTVLPTMERGRNLVVTTAGGGGAFTPLRINFVKIKNLDVVTNGRIVVHGPSAPFLGMVRIKRMEGQ